MASAHYNLPLIAVLFQNGAYNLGEAGVSLLKGDLGNAKSEVDQALGGTFAFWQGYGYEYYKRNQ